MAVTRRRNLLTSVVRDPPLLLQLEARNINCLLASSFNVPLLHSPWKSALSLATCVRVPKSLPRRRVNVPSVLTLLHLAVP